MHLVVLDILFPKVEKKRMVKHRSERILSWIFKHQFGGNWQTLEDTEDSSKSVRRIVDLICFLCVLVSEGVVYFQFVCVKVCFVLKKEPLLLISQNNYVTCLLSCPF